MNKIIISVLACALVGLSAIAFTSNKNLKRAKASLAVESQSLIVASNLATNNEELVSQKQEMIESLESKIGQLIEALTNSTARIAFLSGQVESLKSELDKSEADKERRLLAEVPSAVMLEGKTVYPKVLDRYGRTLAVNAEFSRRFVSKLIFRQLDGAPVSIDVQEIHPAFIKLLELDVAAVIAERTTQNAKDAAARRAAAIQQGIASRIRSENQKIQKQYAAEQAIAQEEWRVKMEAERNERTKADAARSEANAAMRAADAAMIQALNPSSLNIINQNANQNVIRFR